MRNTLFTLTSLALLVFGAFRPLEAAVIPAAQEDVQLRAMLEELNRAKTLQLSTLDKPYYIAIASDDGQSIEITGSLGAILSSTATHVRMPEVRIRVGSYSLDNTNSVFSTSASFGALPLDDNYGAIRTALWLVLDERYKISAGEIARKRNALREISDPATTPDFSLAAPFQLLQPIPPLTADRAKWEEIVRNLSGRFRSHPAITSSSVRMRAISSGFRLRHYRRNGRSRSPKRQPSRYSQLRHCCRRCNRLESQAHIRAALLGVARRTTAPKGRRRRSR